MFTTILVLTVVIAMGASYLRFRAHSNQVASSPTTTLPQTPPTVVDLNEEARPPLAARPMRATGDRLPTLVNGPRAVGWWGIVFLILIETVVVATLIASYFYLRAGVPRWPPAGIHPPELLLPTVNALILLASALPMYWATQRIREGEQKGLLIGLAVAFLMGVLFLGLKVYEYHDKEYTWYTNAYGSIVWTMTGFHAAHVTAVLLKTVAIWVVALRGFFDERRHVAVESNAIYWYFVVAIWIPLYLTIYWAPRLI